MNEKIEKKLKELPNKSGVYIMHGHDGEVIYVGKAKNLKNRVSSYFNNSQKGAKVWAMVEKVDWFEYIITPTELDAFTLENNLIKKEQPFYNILLKDSKTFPYIKINLNEPFPHFVVTRKVEKDGFKYFGPFLAGVSANYIVGFLNKFFHIRTCRQSLNKPLKRACINFEMGLCDAPCIGRISEEEYRKKVDLAIDFLKGEDKFVVDELTNKMNALAETESFEQAIEIRQTLGMIKKLQNQSIANLPKNANKDIIAYITNDLTSAIALITLRNGRILGMQSFSIVDASLTCEEVMENFVLSYYENAIVPEEIITNIKLEDEQVLQTVLGKKVKFISFPKGINFRLLKMAEENAQEHIDKNITRDKQKYDSTIGAIVSLKEKLGLKAIPKRMECYDISHISGTNAVASMVVFQNGEAKKSDYRKMKIKSFSGNDDFRSLQEVLVRRLTRLKNQDGESFKEKPDLLVIDGGKGQLSACLEVLKGMQLDGEIEIISLAKQIEEVFIPNKSKPVLLNRRDAALKLLQRIRDEAHRFAITFHKQTRNKNMFHSLLDEIFGIGEHKKKILLNAFQDVDTIKKCSLEELMAVKGISRSDATRILMHFKNR